MMIKIGGETCMTVSEIANERKLSEREVKQRIRHGDILGFKYGSRWFARAKDCGYTSDPMGCFSDINKGESLDTKR